MANAIDLFCGAGGFSRGFYNAGFNVLLGVDIGENIRKTYERNHKNTQFIQQDISELETDSILDVIDKDIDVVIGGPPCQGFSIAGERDKTDNRNSLFRDFARIIESLQPDIFVMENVPGLLSMENSCGDLVVEEIHKKFSSIGYTSKHKILDSSKFGVPQSRERVFIIGTSRQNSQKISFPSPTHNKNPITVNQALSDLPSLHPGEKSETYDCEPFNNFQQEMRGSSKILHNHHSVNHRDHIIERFRHIPQGGNMADAPEEHQPSKVYKSRNRRLEGNKPSYTVTSHVLDELLHPTQDRSVTVREAARLQSFPDEYVFMGERNIFHGADKLSQYEQVGNAVPVKLSESIAEEAKRALN